MKPICTSEEEPAPAKGKSEAEMLHRMAAYCSATERCCQDVEKKLQVAGLVGAASERILSRLLTEKFIDERRFCRSFVNDKLLFNKWGRIKIGYELKRRNIPTAYIQDALADVDDRKYEEILRSLLTTKKKTIKAKNDYEAGRKLAAFAMGRGFASREIFSMLSRIGYTHADEEDCTDYLE